MEPDAIAVPNLKLIEAASLMKRALSLLDEAAVPGEIGCHLDLAICQLDAILAEVAPQLSESAEPPSLQDSCAWPMNPAA
jgi:hypothetical protein